MSNTFSQDDEAKIQEYERELAPLGHADLYERMLDWSGMLVVETQWVVDEANDTEVCVKTYRNPPEGCRL